MQRDTELSDYFYTRSLVRTIGQVATSVFSLSDNWSLPSTLGFTFLLHTALCPAISNKIQPLPKSIIPTSSDEELIAGRRIFKTLEETCVISKQTKLAKELKKCVQEIDQYIEVREITIDSEQEEEKTKSLKDYLRVYIEAEIQSSH